MIRANPLVTIFYFFKEKNKRIFTIIRAMKTIPTDHAQFQPETLNLKQKQYETLGKRNTNR
jgi:ABC-type antimicrobial peptide transport system ATPase subunit